MFLEFPVLNNLLVTFGLLFCLSIYLLHMNHSLAVLWAVCIKHNIQYTLGKPQKKVSPLMARPLSWGKGLAFREQLTKLRWKLGSKEALIAWLLVEELFLRLP